MTISSDRLRARHLVGAVFLIVWGLATHGTFAGSGDEPHYLMIAHSLAFDGDLDLANDYREARLIGGGTLEPESHVLAREGRLRPVHDVGLPLALAPVVRVAYRAAEWLGEALPPAVLRATRLNTALLLRHQMSLVMALLTGLLASEMFLVLRGLELGPGAAAAWALLFAATPPILSHAYLFFTEIPSALAALFVFRRLRLAPPPGSALAAVLGGLTGFLFLLHARNGGLVLGLALVAWLAWRERALTRRPALAFVAALTVALLARTLITLRLWGTFLTTPHAAFDTTLSAAEVARELYVRGSGLLCDREYGLLGAAPVYVLAAPGLWLLWRRHPRLGRALLAVLAGYLLPVLLPLTNVHGWMGGWSPAARFLVPIAPLFWIGVALYAADASRLGRVLAGALVAVQVAIDAFVWQFPKTLWSDGDGIATLYWSQGLPSWTDPSASAAFALALGIAGAFAVVCGRCAAPVRTP